MPFIPVANTARACMRFSWAGQIVCNVMWFKFAAPPIADDLVQLAELLVTWWEDNLKTSTVNTVSLQAIEAVSHHVAGAPGIEYTTGLPVAGTSGGGPLPNNVSLATKLATGLTGRAHRGRQYFIGLPATALDDPNHVTSAFQAILTGAFDSLLADLLAASIELVVTSLISGGQPRVAGVTTPVTSFSVNPTVDSQRRRLPERGA